MMAYASRTGTRRNLAVLREAGWRLMVSARGVLRTEGFSYALDNGAWTAFNEWLKGTRATPQPCLRAFNKAVDLLGSSADFIIIPDIVEGGPASLAMTRYWMRRLRRDRRLRNVVLLISVQDGMSPADVERWLSPKTGLFVGGSTEWKLATMEMWAKLARARGTICHVGRVNTVRRIRLCEQSGVHSFDGSSVSRFSCNLPRLDSARQEISILGILAREAA